MKAAGKNSISEVTLRSVSLAVMAALAGFSATVALADGQDQPVVAVAAEHLFIPTGFDDNDTSEVVVAGILPNACYSSVKGELIVDQQNREITVTPKARIAPGPCLQVVVPYSTVFEVGILPMGSYKVKVAGSDIEKTLTVAESTSAGPDDELYASVDNAYVSDIPAQNRRVIVIEGVYTNTCMRWDRTELIHRSPDVVEVLPIVKMVDGPACAQVLMPFKGTAVDLPVLKEGRYLLHVRSMNGTSLNRVFSIEE